MSETWKKDGPEGNEDDLMQCLGEQKLSVDEVVVLLQEEKLDEAIQIGAERGRRKIRRQKVNRISWQTAIAAVSMLLLLTAFVRVSPAFAAILKEVPGFGGFVELIVHDKSIVTALDNEYIQPLQLTDERNGYKFTVSGVIADSQRAIIFYKVEGEDMASASTLIPSEVTNGDGGSLNSSISFNHNFREQHEKETRVVHDYLDIRLVPGETMPEIIDFKLLLGNEPLQVRVPIDHNRFEELEERIILNETLEIGGQKVIVKEAVVSPLMISIKVEAASGNDKVVTDFVDLHLEDEKGRIYRTPGSSAGFGRIEEGMTRLYESSYFHKPKQLTLKATGLLMHDRDMKLVIDTEQKTIVSKPDKKLALKEMSKSGGYIDFKLSLDQQDDPEVLSKGYWIIEYAGKYRDAAGREYQMMDQNGVQTSFSPHSKEGIYYYRILDEEYEQPLTFDIYDYPGYIVQDISLRIK